MVESFDLDCSGLVLDMTNFATYIDSANDRAPIAQRGHAKQKRNDLRLVGLGLVVSTDGGIPLVSHAYAGQPSRRHPVPDVVDELAGALRTIAEAALRAHRRLRRRPGLGDNQSQDGEQPAALRRLAAAVGPQRPAGRARAATASVDESSFPG
jgi:hypothetical protein